ncbi:hypothetical protein [Hymenobacter lucidus]|uniref:Uncharacterized protein n=1 Tax=Hymenobacter lucidus TaxID=2880930 RepID=A0ABS8AQA5_9BACT|nr:hypothetical protein [Hymenobacter lucidus]MCB2407192.1 hypothetical protein [Hymenobacter lucidus]
MVKITSLLGLLLLTTSAALAQRQPTPSRYLMLVREIDGNDFDANRRSSLTVVEPDGTFKTEEIQVNASLYPKRTINGSISRFSPDSTGNSERRVRYSRNLLFQAETRKVNELSAQGWQLVSTTQEGFTTRYLFRKDAAAQ